MIGKNKIINYQ